MSSTDGWMIVLALLVVALLCGGRWEGFKALVGGTWALLKWTLKWTAAIVGILLILALVIALGSGVHISSVGALAFLVVALYVHTNERLEALAKEQRDRDEAHRILKRGY